MPIAFSCENNAPVDTTAGESLSTLVFYAAVPNVCVGSYIRSGALLTLLEVTVAGFLSCSYDCQLKYVSVHGRQSLRLCCLKYRASPGSSLWGKEETDEGN